MIVQEFATPQDALVHFGVKGMQWGVRKERAQTLHGVLAEQGSITRTTKNGDAFTLSTKPPQGVAKTLAFTSKRYNDLYRRSAFLEITDKHGSKIGAASFSFEKKDPKTAYLSWVTIDKSARGQGYATEVLKSAEVHMRKQGVTKMVLEVPPVAKDAQHIYKKMGFENDTVVNSKRDSEDFIRMVRNLEE